MAEIDPLLVITGKSNLAEELTGYCYVERDFTVYLTYHLKDILDLQDNPRCTICTDYDNYYQYCGASCRSEIADYAIVKFQTLDLVVANRCEN